MRCRVMGIEDGRTNRNASIEVFIFLRLEMDCRGWLPNTANTGLKEMRATLLSE